MPVVHAPPKSQYELERDARIKRNEAFLVSLGLGKDGAAKLKAPKKAQRTPPKKKAPQGPRRTSARLSKGASPVERLTYEERDWDDMTPRPRKRARRGKAAADLTDDERAMLGAFDMEAFEEFLTDEHPIS